MEYNYTGGQQVFIAPYAGTYKLEVWGAQGGNSTNEMNFIVTGGYGSYSKGNTYLSSGNILYIYVGGQGNDMNAACQEVTNGNGYNGGGNAGCQTSNHYASGGGGATHIALDSGLLSELSSHTADGRILIVAGGGGGVANRYKDTKLALPGGSESCASTGGAAGGYIGNGTAAYYGSSEGGTQSSAGLCKTTSATYGATHTCGGFGFGCSPTATTAGWMLSAGGGGWYGGGCDTHTGGGGGSGYIGSSSLIQNTASNINNKMYCYNCQEDGNLNTYTVSTYGMTNHESERDTTNCPDGYSSNPVGKCAKAGNGYARITLISKS